MEKGDQQLNAPLNSKSSYLLYASESLMYQFSLGCLILAQITIAVVIMAYFIMAFTAHYSLDSSGCGMLICGNGFACGVLICSLVIVIPSSKQNRLRRLVSLLVFDWGVAFTLLIVNLGAYKIGFFAGNKGPSQISDDGPNDCHSAAVSAAFTVVGAASEIFFLIPLALYMAMLESKESVFGRNNRVVDVNCPVVDVNCP